MAKLNRKGSVAREIQNYFIKSANRLIEGDFAWTWFPIPNNTDFCVAIEWQDGYDKNDKDFYGDFMSEDGYVINASIKFTDEFALNGEYALYAEYYYTDEDALEGGISLTQWDVKDKFCAISKHLAEEFNRFNRMKKKRDA